MVHEPEFVRGNQKSYIRILCDDTALKSYEYQMCSYNVLNSLLGFQQRSQNGSDYLYYEISGMQSLDIFLQTQKLKRPCAIMLSKSIVKLCRELSEYALDIDGVIFSPRYIMISSNGEEVKFLYSFAHEGKGAAEMEQFLECCIEYLDYRDELLMEKLFGLYERLTEQKDNFLLDAEMDAFREVLMEPVVVDISCEVQEHGVTSAAGNIPEGVTVLEEQPEETASKFKGKYTKGRQLVGQRVSLVAQKESRNLKRGLKILFLGDIAALIFWKPLTLLKIFFSIAVGIVLLMLHVCLNKKEKKGEEELEIKKQEHTYLEEYERLAAQNAAEDNYTQFIVIEDSEGVLYNLQECEPQYIYIGAEQKIIGKDSERVQIHISQEGISRIHALVKKEGQECIIEDLNSTNGTWINGKLLEPRTRHVLKQGDKVRFAGLEYIFR